MKNAAEWLHRELVPVYFRTAGSGDDEAILKAANKPHHRRISDYDVGKAAVIKEQAWNRRMTFWSSAAASTVLALHAMPAGAACR
ncbi:MAG: hypothetical protein REI95_00345 [Oxalicibacterium faecigallinarum]|uniref:hypothetical protein n=1 Tax=Oxalicibacterium faecigallinarum TaxID=573741 RepID=UPI001662F49B|nr:hypothetical protein [Oxalicibacterium faecigallinarum]MDQ7968069.1 hypothetical protein [Oxalicibacterium faecigallinarum]